MKLEKKSLVTGQFQSGPAHQLKLFCMVHPSGAAVMRCQKWLTFLLLAPSTTEELTEGRDRENILALNAAIL